MWSYIARRLLVMIPTLFGITVVSFCIMQLAPGDPLLNQLGQAGGAGQSTQTREQFLVQKRDLKLDKPLILNFRSYSDYGPSVRSAAWYRSRTHDEIVEDLAELAKPSPAPAAAERLAFLRSLKMESFSERLADPKHHKRLATAIEGFTMIFAEDAGRHGVPPAIELLRSDPDTRMKAGAMRCLASMVIDPFTYTYTRRAGEDETPLILATWSTWWGRARSGFAAVPPSRQAAVLQIVDTAGARTSYKELLQVMTGLSKEDIPVLAEKLLGPSTLRQKVACSLALSLLAGKPLKLDVPLDAARPQVNEVAENWLAHFEARKSEYLPGHGAKAAAILMDTQYAHMVWRLITFDFGRSATPTRDPVSTKIWDALLVSAPLMLLAQVFIYLMAVPLGIYSAVKKGRWQDQGITLGLFLLYSIPNFVAAMMFLVLFCYGDFLKLFPMSGLHSYGAENYSTAGYWLDYLWHIILPVICLALFSIAGLAMYSRTSMLDIINQDFIRTARAKGLAERTVIMKHALRNALIPIITLFSNFLPAMLGGSVLIEVLFNIPGMGRLSFSSIEQKDFPTLMALIYIDAIVVMASILISDILYAFVDPRITFESRGRAA